MNLYAPYHVIWATTGPAMEQALNQAIVEGYVPVGGIALSDGEYLQAVININKKPMSAKTVELMQEAANSD